ncbi:endonuclease/exonuclease/phosphatase family protein [Roseobacter sinensis]|uniref:Endonuclease/exonuclease/phosphatase family protein n=1 Tax=Roseobacter sinensis TaxID=2931391 RepID=A0ABT3BAV7_9RHOB|nr:endonuclease/exonuclease/phosphatase family protein [Roseobacter sp. WL0113]MCV3270706.1 endonuclease/exonuclease/phosphatase family protein [Roseobacter sp. WL0113]
MRNGHSRRDTTDPDDRRVMRIASYNIRKAVGLDWRRDPERIADVLAEIDADVVVLQEADKRTGTREGVLPLDRLEGELGYVLADVSARPLSHGWHGNAILMRERFAVRETSRIDIPSLEPRGAVAVRVGPPDLEVVGVHLGLTRAIRRKQMTALQAYLDRCDHPVIIAGDFNEWNGDKMEFNAGTQVVSPGPSFHAARPVTALDRFVLAGALEPVAAHVHRSDLARRASDHLPIVVDVQFAVTSL